MQPVYLDYNSTTPVMPEVMDAMMPYLKCDFGNPSSGHIYGRVAKKGVELARQQVADLISADPLEIIFTGCATEANNLALFGLARSAAPNRRHFITSAIEHPSVMRPCLELQRQGWEATFLQVDGYGGVDIGALKARLCQATAFVSIMHANNEIGTIQPIAEIAACTRAQNIPLHVDAAQSVGKITVNVRELDVDALTIASHKLYGPKGVGALYIRKGVRLHPLTYGADHEFGLRPGTENVMSIVGLGEASRLAKHGLCHAKSALRKSRDRLHSLLSSAIPNLTLNGHPTNRLPNTLHVSFPNANGRLLLQTIESEVAASLGSACHSGEHSVSGVLAAINATQEQVQGAVRFSVGIPTTKDEINRAAQAIVAAWRQSQVSSRRTG